VDKLETKPMQWMYDSYIVAIGSRLTKMTYTFIKIEMDIRHFDVNVIGN